ncbi:MAG: squalene synthase HpnC [Dehalococcoidia bacterium]
MIAEGPPRPYSSLAEGYAYCRRLATSHYENFTVASWLLPRALRPHVYAVYAYCRGVDDLGDEAEGDRLALLDDWEAELRRCYEGSPRLPAFVALQETIRRFDIPREPFLRLIEANRADQRVSRYRTYNDLMGYCEYSANPVGRLVLHLFGYRDEERQNLSDATCTALQLTNFWQDVRRDLDKGRIYIPLEDMERFSYSEDDLRAGRSNGRFRELMAFEVQRTREQFRRGLALIPKVSGRLRLDLRLFSLGGLAVLDAIEAIGYDVLQRRPALSRAHKAWLVVRGLLPVPVRVEKAA